MDTHNLEAVLADLRGATLAAQGKASGTTPEAGDADFSQILKGALEQVNQAQQNAHKITEDFAAGEGDMNLQDVMINLQKANLSFQQMVQVRNKLVTAYHDVMNMSV
ncbi:MAG TPA: flagellar hook-basal body complex protein FliE [Rhodocyclaceae bacterium]|nr:flagellar hook-basal body complex protein FliE [Rhodocyclaceae bacterium]